MNDLELLNASIYELGVAMDNKLTSATDIVSTYLQRVNAYEGGEVGINAFITLNSNALTLAGALDEERERYGRRSLLHGIPIVVKDLFNTKDLPTTAGFIPFRYMQCHEDATVIEKLKHAGAIVLGKSNMSDWFGVAPQGMQSAVGGRTKNPYNLNLTPGRSSGGTAAAISSGFASLGLASETGVSIRNPASNNNLFAVVPTPGLISRHGLIMNSHVMERAGFVSRNVYDLAVGMQSVSGYDARDSLTRRSVARRHLFENLVGSIDTKKIFKVGVLTDMYRDGNLHREGIGLVNEAINKLQLYDVNIVHGLSTGLDLFTVLSELRDLNMYEMRDALDNYFKLNKSNLQIRDSSDFLTRYQDDLKPGILPYLNSDSSMVSSIRKKRWRQTHELGNVITRLMDLHNLDALVYPFKSEPALSEHVIPRESDNPLSSVCGLPAVIVPAGFTSADNAPIAMEILGRRWGEPDLLALARRYERHVRRWTLPVSTPYLSSLLA